MGSAERAYNAFSHVIPIIQLADTVGALKVVFGAIASLTLTPGYPRLPRKGFINDLRAQTIPPLRLLEPHQNLDLAQTEPRFFWPFQFRRHGF